MHYYKEMAQKTTTTVTTTVLQQQQRYEPQDACYYAEPMELDRGEPQAALEGPPPPPAYQPTLGEIVLHKGWCPKCVGRQRRPFACMDDLYEHCVHGQKSHESLRQYLDYYYAYYYYSHAPEGPPQNRKLAPAPPRGADLRPQNWNCY